MLLGTSYINKLVKGIFPAKRKTVRFNSGPVPILTITESDSAEDQADVTSLLEDDNNKRQGPIRVVRQVRLPPMLKTTVLLNTNTKRLLLVESDKLFKAKCPCRTATGIIDAFPSHLFTLLVVNASLTEVQLQKHHVNASTSTPPSEILYIKSDKPFAYTPAPQVDTVNAVHHRAVPDRP